MRGYQVLGAHTDVGKTYVACALLRAARAKGLSVSVFKPVLSGFDPAAVEDSDAGRLIAAAGLWLDTETLDAVAPLRFAAPLAPPQAARREGVDLTLAELAQRTQAWLQRPADFMLLESAGGVMSPIARDGLALHLATEIALPALLVGGGYLGGISHSLTALAVSQASGVEVAAIVVSQDADPTAPDFGETVAAVCDWAGETPVIAAARGETDWATALV